MPRTKQLSIKKIIPRAKKTLFMNKILVRRTPQKNEYRSFGRFKPSIKSIRKYHKSVK